MSDALRATLTAAGLRAAADADAQGIAVKITRVALGTAQYTVATNGDGLATQTALVAERERVEIAAARKVGDAQVDITFLVDGPAQYWVREIGYFLEDGTLFAVWSDPVKPIAYKNANVPILLALELVLSQLPTDVVEVVHSAAQLELIMTREAAITARAIADTQMRLFQLSQALGEKLDRAEAGLIGAAAGQGAPAADRPPVLHHEIPAGGQFRLVIGTPGDPQAAELQFDADDGAWRLSVAGVPQRVELGPQGLKFTSIPHFATAGAAQAAGMPRGTVYRKDFELYILEP